MLLKGYFLVVIGKSRHQISHIFAEVEPVTSGSHLSAPKVLCAAAVHLSMETNGCLQCRPHRKSTLKRRICLHTNIVCVCPVLNFTLAGMVKLNKHLKTDLFSLKCTALFKTRLVWIMINEWVLLIEPFMCVCLSVCKCVCGAGVLRHHPPSIKSNGRMTGRTKTNPSLQQE